MLINKISMHGFKKHNDLVEYRLGKTTKIYGDNDQGKTTIGEAVAWAFLGADLTGNEKATKRLTNPDCKDVYVEIDFIFKGKEHNLVRRRRGSMQIYLDDAKVHQHELLNFYRSKELFLSIFYPFYFPALTPKNAKELLTSTLKPIPKEKVYEELGESIANKLKETGFNIPNLYLENQRARLREISDDLNYWDGFKDAQQEDEEVPKEEVFDDRKLKEYQEELSKLNALTISPKHDIEDLLVRREELRGKVQSLELEVRELSRREPKLKDVKGLILEQDSLRSQYLSKQKELKTLDNKIYCPNCEAEIDLDISRKEGIGNDLEQLGHEGIELGKQIEKLQEDNSKIKKEHEEKTKKEVLEKNEKIKKLKLEIESLNIEKLVSENKEYAQKHESKVAKQRTELEQKILILQEEKQKVELNNLERIRVIKRQEDLARKIKESEKTIKDLNDEKADVEKCIDYAKRYNSTSLRLQGEQIDKHLDKVTIQLERIVESTGELKGDFKVLYDDKEFQALSNSERIKAGLEIANLLINTSGLTLPVFVDNAEGITRIPKLNTQMIEARVKDDAELTVEVA